MAVGDITDVELQATLTTTNTDTSLLNSSSSYVTIIDSICLTIKSGGTTNRTVTIYKNGSAAANEILNIDLNAVSSKSLIFTDTRIKLTGTQSLYFKQDSGTDVNILVTGTKEQIA